MPPGRWLKRPACANAYAIAIDPSAVTIQESSEIAPMRAMLVGSMTMPDPIMLTATMNVSWVNDIFCCLGMCSLRRTSERVGAAGEVHRECHRSRECAELAKALGRLCLR